MFEKWRLKRRIRRAVRLRRQLRELFGKSETYTSGQVQRALREAKAIEAVFVWAFAAHCSQSEFEAACPGEDYVGLREQIAGLCLDGDDRFPAIEGMRDNHVVAICDRNALGIYGPDGFDVGGGGGDN